MVWPHTGQRSGKTSIDAGEESSPTGASGGVPMRIGGGWLVGVGDGGRRGGLEFVAVGVCHSHHASAQAGMGREDAVVTVAVDARRRDEASERGEEVERREDEQRAAVGCGARRPVEDLSHAPGVRNGVVAALA